MTKMPQLLLRLSAIGIVTGSALGGCAWITPDDPYLQAKNVPALEVPPSLDSPSPDPNLAVPAGEIADKPIKGGHTPPTDPLGKPSE